MDVEGKAVRNTNDFEEFCDDLERDKDYRKDVPIFRDPLAKPKPTQEEEAGEAPVVDVTEMLDELRIDDGEDDVKEAKRVRTE